MTLQWPNALRQVFLPIELLHGSTCATKSPHCQALRVTGALQKRLLPQSLEKWQNGTSLCDLKPALRSPSLWLLPENQPIAAFGAGRRHVQQPRDVLGNTGVF